MRRCVKRFVARTINRSSAHTEDLDEVAIEERRPLGRRPLRISCCISWTLETFEPSAGAGAWRCAPIFGAGLTIGLTFGPSYDQAERTKPRWVVGASSAR